MKRLDGWQIPLGVIGFLLIGGLTHEMIPWLQAYPIIAGSMIAGTVAISVGLITFSGVRLTLKHATQRMHFELENSRREAEEERKYAVEKAKNERIATMRREVYLEAVTELVSATHYLGGLMSLDFAKDQIDEGLHDFQVIVAKVAMVGDVDTVLKARSLSVKFATILLQGAEILLPMTIHAATAALQQRFNDDAHLEMKRLIAAMAHHNENRGTQPEDRAKFALLERAHESQLQIANAALDKMQAAHKEIAEARAKYYEFFLGQSRSLLEDIDALLSSVREELGLVTDRAAFSAQTDTLLEQLRTSANRVVEQSAKIIKDDEGGLDSQQ